MESCLKQAVLKSPSDRPFTAVVCHIFSNIFVVVKHILQLKKVNDIHKSSPLLLLCYEENMVSIQYLI